MKYFSRLNASKKKVSVVVGYVFIFMLLVLCLYSSRVQESTDRLFDVIRTTPERKEVVIIGIDDASLQTIGAWPWNREIFANLLTVLDENNVRASIFDVLFFEPREGDEDFAEALANANHQVVLASKVENGVYLSSYLAGTSTATFSALANVHPDSDGKIRVYPQRSLQQEKCILSLSEQAFFIYTKKEVLTCLTHENQFRYPTQITTYSLIDVLQRKIPQEQLQDKVVFIGSTSLGLEDHFVGIQGNKVPGVYVHASAFTSLLQGIADKHVSKTTAIILIAILMFVTVWLSYVLKRVLLQVVSIFGLIALLIGISVVAFSFDTILPLSLLIASVFLTASYVALIRFVQEQERNTFIEQVFSKYVHKDILKELITSRKELSLGGERKQLTVLFSDLRGFTSFSESMTPEELTTLLNNYLSAMTPCILEERGTIDKFIGDAIMAFWNAPLDVTDHQRRAVLSALRMQQALKDFNNKNGASLAMGIGLHTGQATVGNVGGKDRVNYTVLGDTVNLASRIESLTKKYGVDVMTTKQVVDVIADPSLAFRCLDVITVVGKTTPTVLYEVRYAHDFREGLITDYEKAFKLYYEGKWDKAESAFKKLAKEGDIPSQKMLVRIPDLRQKKDWDGVYRFDEK